MYKNFNITEEEKTQIMQMHESNGYKTPVNEIFGMQWLTKLKVDSPDKLTDEQKLEMARNFQGHFNGRIAVEFEAGEWYDAEKKIDNIDEYEEYVNTEIYPRGKEPHNQAWKEKIQSSNKSKIGPDAEHEYRFKSFDDYIGDSRKGLDYLNESLNTLKSNFKRFI